MKIINPILFLLTFFIVLSSCRKDRELPELTLAKEIQDELPGNTSLNNIKSDLNQLNKASSTDMYNLFEYYNNI